MATKKDVINLLNGLLNRLDDVDEQLAEVRTEIRDMQVTLGADTPPKKPRWLYSAGFTAKDGGIITISGPHKNVGDAMGWSPTNRALRHYKDAYVYKHDARNLGNYQKIYVYDRKHDKWVKYKEVESTANIASEENVLGPVGDYPEAACKYQMHVVHNGGSITTIAEDDDLEALMGLKVNKSFDSELFNYREIECAFISRNDENNAENREALLDWDFQNLRWLDSIKRKDKK